MIQAKLKLEILAGYLVLVSCFAFIICLVHEERGKKSAMERQELRWQGERWLTNRTFVGLLDLTAMGELVSGWTEKDYADYHKKRMEVDSLLQALKAKQEDEAQRACIDSVRSLLAQKERQMGAILHLLENMPDAGEIIKKKMPAILSQTTKQPLSAGKDNDALQPAEKKKNDFWGFLKKKREKSAYALQREQAQTGLKETNMKTVPPPAMLHSLEREINDTTRIYEERLLAQTDSLRMQNRRMNGRINLLIDNFERKETETFCREMQMQQAVRNHSFHLIAGIGIGAFVLVILLYIILHRDMNRRYRYRTELEASNRRNGELSQSRRNILLTVSHDLRAPLGTISGYAELIPEEKDEELRNRYAENILHASHHVAGLANSLLYYNRLEAGKERVNREVFHPGRVMENAIQSFRLPAEKKGLGLTMELEGMDTMVEGDRTRLEQILNNLLANAVKFTRTGSVHVGGSLENGQLRFFVRDTGAGISGERQKRIFTAFERIEEEGAQPGFGLGLSITAKLVALLGGTIGVESREGHGSTFEVCLPMPEAGKQEAGDMVETGHPDLTGLRVVLIDDDRMQTDMTRRMLARRGITCDCCHNLKELTERLRDKPYDLLLTDMQMPETDGYGVLELLRNSNLGQSRDIPVIAVTARPDEKADKLAGAGFAGCLHKPFSTDELLAAVAGCAGNRQPSLLAADFTELLDGEEDRKGMLDMFVQDTEKTLAELREAVSEKDYTRISALIHKGVPLWETIRIGIPATELERLASVPPQAWDDTLPEEVRKLVKAVEASVEAAGRLRKEME